MALCSDFEGLRGSILHRSPLSSIDSFVDELLNEEIPLKSHSNKWILFAWNPSILTLFSKLLPNNQDNTYTRVSFEDCSFFK